MTGQLLPFDNDLTAEIERLRFALQAATVGTWDYDLLTGQAQWSSICKELFGLPAHAEVTAPILLQQVHPEDRERVGLANAKALSPASDGRHNIRFRTLNPQGALRWVEAKGQVLRGSQGEAVRFSGVVQDVTQGVLDRQKLEESENKLRRIIAAAPAGIGLFLGRELIIEYPNQTFIDIVGKGPEVEGIPLREAMPELMTEGQLFLQILDDIYTTGEPFISPASLVRIVQDGVLKDNYYNISYTPIRNTEGEIYAILDIAIDVTVQVLAQQQLKTSEAQFRSIVEQAPMAIGLFKGREMIIEVGNDRIFEVWAKDRSVIGLPVVEALPEIKGQGYIELLAGVYDTGKAFAGNGLLVRLKRHGQLEDVYFDLVYTPLRNAEGVIDSVMVLANEVTQQVLARQQIEHSENQYRELSAELEQQVQLRTKELQATVGDLQRSNANLEQFAYIASHDLQEPLRKIQQFGDLLVNQYGDQLGDRLDYLQRMQSAASRMSTLVRDLLTYSRIAPQREGNELVSLTTVLQMVLTDLELRVEETKAIIDLASLPTVLGDASQLAQLFHNLLSNALKFSRRDELGQSISPVIQIKAVSLEAQALPTSIKLNRMVEVYHRIDVTDNGIGFDTKYLDRIFQVFQRLHGKSAYAGTGIGLAICEKVAANHGGAITAVSQPGQGATFSVYLPA